MPIARRDRFLLNFLPVISSCAGSFRLPSFVSPHLQYSIPTCYTISCRRAASSVEFASRPFDVATSNGNSHRKSPNRKFSPVISSFSFSNYFANSSRGSLALRAASSSSMTSKTMLEPIVSISDTFDGGNGELVSVELNSRSEEDDSGDNNHDVLVTVRMKPDPFTELEDARHFQYFSFRSTLYDSPLLQKSLKTSRDESSVKVKYLLQNAGKASFPEAWEGSSIFYTNKHTPFDPDSWGRTGDTLYDEATGALSWTHTYHLSKDSPPGDRSATAYFAYFPPYSYDRHLELIARCAEAKGCKHRSLGQTLSGREIDCITIGTGPRTCWIIHRQHPGETMAEFYAEGLLERLLGLNFDEVGSKNGDELDKVAKKAREMYTFHIVPNMNPDGSFNGHLRTNSVGSNLNREWAPSLYSPSLSKDNAQDSISDNKVANTSGDKESKVLYEAPTLKRSPEVYHVLRHMDLTSCDAFLDIHGDEALPFNFLAGSEGISIWSKRLESLHGAFLAEYERVTDGVMQRKVSYEPDPPLEAKTNICSNQIGLRFDCFSGTLEMPFKELWTKRISPASSGNASGGDSKEGSGLGVDEGKGWGPGMAKELGASVLEPLCYICPYLREGELWKDLPEEDAYVRPSSKY